MSWIKISISTTPDEAELMADLLSGLDALAVSLIDGGTEELFQLFPEQTPLWQHTVVQALYPAEQNGETIIDQLQILLGGKQLTYRIENIAEQDWVRETQAAFQPIHIADLLSI